MTGESFEYLVLENLGNGQMVTITSRGGFATEDAARAAADAEATLISKSTKKTLSLDVRRVPE